MGANILTLHPYLQTLLHRHLDACSGSGLHVVITQTTRTMQEQAFLYAQGRTTPGPACTHKGKTFPVGTCPLHPFGLVVTHAQPGHSYHNYGLAYDIALSVVTAGVPHASWDTSLDTNANGIPDFNDVGALGEGAGLTWGGRWPEPTTDLPHFEYTFGLSIQDLLNGAKIPDSPQV